jgi:tRNA uracil 4-sulfurtransferase
MSRPSSVTARGAEALVAGDSLGQVASQTLPNLAVVEEAAELPLLRPLIDRDKSEIVEIAKQLGTCPGQAGVRAGRSSSSRGR